MSHDGLTIVFRLIGQRLRESLFLRVLTTSFLVLLLQIPIGAVDGVVRERRATRDEAVAAVVETAGGQQTVLGPVLVLPMRERGSDAEGKPVERAFVRYVLPESLEVDVRATMEVRRRGIFDVPLYVATLRLGGRLALDEETRRLVDRGAEVRWDEAQVCLGVSDPRALREAAVLRLGEAHLAFQPGPGGCGLLPAGMHVRLDRPLDAEGAALSFGTTVVLGGSERLAFVPVGSATTVTAEVPWPTPSFDGAFLPRTRQVTDAGFRASWRVLHLGRNFPAAFEAGQVARERLEQTAFGASFLAPVDAYRVTERAVKYQLLLLGLTATLFFLFELLQGRRVHPVQYLLIGLALCLFYLLLLSLSEHLGFVAAYAVAAAAITVLVTAYGRAILGARPAAALGGLLAGLYGLLFVLLQAQDLALLAGALALLAALALVMFLTRRVDWYGRRDAETLEVP